MFVSIFLDSFLKTLAITLGIGSGLLGVITLVFVLLIISYPITKRFK